VRALVLDRIDPAVVRERHRQFASALSGSEPADLEVMAHHLERGGLPKEAADYYAQAAAAAANALAFEHAAVLYQRPLGLKEWAADEQRGLRAQLGDALNNAGRGADAAGAYLAASAAAPSAIYLELRHRAALALLTSGHVDEGLSCLRPVLRKAGIRLA